MNDYEKNEEKNIQGDKSFLINGASSLEMWYCRPESKDKDGPNLACYKMGWEWLDA